MIEKVTKMTPAEFAGIAFDCDCGRRHSVSIRHIATGTGILAEALGEVLRPYAGKKVMLVADNNTYPVAGERVKGLIQGCGCSYAEFIIVSDTALVLDEFRIGQLLLKVEEDVSYIVTVGSGNLNDLTRVVAHKMQLPYCIVGTAPSMDGYASAVSPIVMEGHKKSVRLGPPDAIICDSELMRTAPDVMLSAGVGDILGKYVAMVDWKLARLHDQEYYCETIAAIVKEAVERCVADIDKVTQRDDAAITSMADTLVLSGVTISLHGVNSRPASGCEHQIAHCWEVDNINAGNHESLHGNYVGAGTILACRMYEVAKERFPDLREYQLPSSEEVREMLGKLYDGRYYSLQTLGVSRESFYNSFLHADEANGRYTLVTYLREKGCLEEFARMMTEEFYGK